MSMLDHEVASCVQSNTWNCECVPHSSCPSPGLGACRLWAYGAATKLTSPFTKFTARGPLTERRMGSYQASEVISADPESVYDAKAQTRTKTAALSLLRDSRTTTLPPCGTCG